MKRFISLTLLLVALLSFNGCSNSVAKTDPNAPTKTSASGQLQSKANLIAQIQLLKAKYGNNIGALMADPKMHVLINDLQALNKN